MTKKERQEQKREFNKRLGKRGLTVYDNLRGICYSYVKSKEN